MMEKDKYHNGYTVLRLIAIMDLNELLMNPIMDTLVTNLWESPYTIEHYFYQDFDVSLT